MCVCVCVCVHSHIYKINMFFMSQYIVLGNCLINSVHLITPNR